VLGWGEFELEVMRDRNDNVVIVCSIENVDRWAFTPAIRSPSHLSRASATTPTSCSATRRSR